MALPAALAGIFRQRQKTYKMVLILALLETMSHLNGQAKYEEVRQRFLSFYQKRESSHQVVDAPLREMTSWQEATVGQANLVLDSPISALSSILTREKRFDEDWIGFRPEVWIQMNSEVMEELRKYAYEELEAEISKMQANNSMSLSKVFSQVLDQYPMAKTQPRGGHEIANLVTNQIPSYLKDLPFVSDKMKIQGSVGRPNWVRMPWIALMDSRVTTTTQMGYYVCYIFTENMEAVYLTLKISDESVRHYGKKEGLNVLQKKVEDLRRKYDFHPFSERNPPEAITENGDYNYLVGVVAFARYDREHMPNDEKLCSDLREMITHYEMIVQYEQMNSSSTNEEEPDILAIVPERIADHRVQEILTYIKNYIGSRGFSYPARLIENFYLSLKTKPFVILAGISGTGKTKLVKLFAEALGATRENGQFTLIPVRPDWSDPSDLIGYKDISGNFQPGVFTSVLLEASKPSTRLKHYFICLDEMNLARVEHYFSDLLSLMETQEWELDEAGEKRIVMGHVVSTSSLLSDSDKSEYGNLCIPDNVYIIGTVNMDETTHPFSKKVLDRANTIEFNYIDLDNLAELENMADKRPDPLTNVHQSFLRSDYLTLQAAIEYKDLIKDTTAKLTKVNQILEPIHAHVGFRIRDAISFYMIYNQRFELLQEDDAFDIQLCQKILPRIQGSSSAVQKTLVHLLDFATNEDFALSSNETLKTNDLYEESSLLSQLLHGDARQQLQNAPYPESAKKIVYMLRRLEEDGFTSFWLS